VTSDARRLRLDGRFNIYLQGGWGLDAQCEDAYRPSPRARAVHPAVASSEPLPCCATQPSCFAYNVPYAYLL
jgi:hypothetical protein